MFYKSKLKKCIEVAQPYFEDEITIERLQNRRRTKDHVLAKIFCNGASGQEQSVQQTADSQHA